MGFREQLLQQAGNSFLAGDLNLLVPRIEIQGDRRVIIENHEGILEYGSEVMRVKSGRISVKITGDGLELANVTLSDLTVTGKIISVELL